MAQVSRDRRFFLFERDDWKCFYCGNVLDAVLWKQHYELDYHLRPAELSLDFRSHAPTVDHKTPTHRGGTDKDDNLVAACLLCNSRKRQLTLDEYRFKVERDTGGYGKAADLLRDSLSTASTPFDGEVLRIIEWLEDHILPIKFYGESLDV